MRQFNLLWGLNETNEIFATPYFRAMYALSLMNGPNIDDWAHNQVTKLRERSTRQQNPIARDQEQHWNDLKNAFETAFTDIAKEQNATQKLLALRMYRNDIDTYISTFETLVVEAGYNRDAKGTVHLFAQGLSPSLLRDLLYSPTIPQTMDDWQTRARDEVKNNAFRETMLRPDKHHYKWQFQQQNNGQGRQQHRRRPNDQTVPMDVDPPVFTQVNKAYTEEDKKQHRTSGRCFTCSRQGHMAKNCPFKQKQQQFSRPKTGQPNWRTTTPSQSTPRKSNQFKKRTFQKPQRFGQPSQSFARTANIQEVHDEDDEEDVPSLAARAANFNDGQHEQWVEEMKALGINF